jgi:hypothetical protein
MPGFIHSPFFKYAIPCYSAGVLIISIFYPALAPSLKKRNGTKKMRMKKIVFAAVLFLSVSVINKTDAQVRFNINVNLNSQPNWGPAGYDYVEYYYLPDIQAYYYVPRRQFVYLAGNNWIFSYNLPPAYRNYDLYSGYKVVINEPRPYLRHTVYRQRYSGYRGGYRNQPILRDHRHDHDRDRGNGRGHGRGNGRH